RPRDLPRRPRHLRQLRGAGPRARPHLPLRPPRELRRGRRGPCRAGPGGGTLGLDRPRGRLPPPLRHPPGRHLRGAEGVVGPEVGAREGRVAARAADRGGVKLRAALLGWYRAHRRDLPWRRTRDPYAIWISEAMLQQT